MADMPKAEAGRHFKTLQSGPGKTQLKTLSDQGIDKHFLLFV
jgi:hypothetical protein